MQEKAGEIIRYLSIWKKETKVLSELKTFKDTNIFIHFLSYQMNCEALLSVIEQTKFHYDQHSYICLKNIGSFTQSELF